ncbi:MAG: hypothetical protein QM791_18085 [Ferruginibacter sp.]
MINRYPIVFSSAFGRTLNLVIVLLLLPFNFLSAQNYQAIHGSMYAGSLSPANNPAAVMHMPFKWHVTLFALQLKHTTNAFKINDLSLLQFSPSKTTVTNTNGIKKRFLYANQDIHLFNASIKLNAKSAISFGANIRNYISATVSESNWQDSIFSLAEFLSINTGHRPLSGRADGAAWAELYGSYARNIIDDGDHLLNAGVTVKVNRSLAGGYARAEGVQYVPAIDAGGRINYLLTGGSLQYGYSNNFDFIDSSQSFNYNSKNFLKRTYSSISADIGVEYIQLSNMDEDEYKYDTKIGIALMDLGSNRYRYSSNSRTAVAGKENITDGVLEDKFTSVRDIKSFNDSLASIANAITGINGDFVMYQPTRLIINVDRRLKDDFYLNAELMLPVVQLAAKNSLHIKDMNLLAITPRWETEKWGVYMPLLLNIRNQVWLGGAVKAGPVLLGIHNLANIFSKTSIQKGGFYLAVSIRPPATDGRTSAKLSKAERRKLDCPKF